MDNTPAASTRKTALVILVPALVLIVLVAVTCLVFWSVYLRHRVVNVILRDGQIQARPVVLESIKSSMRFEVENQGSQPHQFILIITKRGPGQLPVRDGVAQFYTDPGEETAVIYDGFQNGGFIMWGPQPNPPLGPPLEPGETRTVDYGIPSMGVGPQVLTILCNLPGHYEAGEYTTIEVK